MVGSSVFYGRNDYRKSHPHCRDRDFLRGTHAEVAAVLRHPYPHHGTLYVARFARDGQAVLARPCAVCQRALKALGVREVYYTDAEGAWAPLELDAIKPQGARPRNGSRALWLRR